MENAINQILAIAKNANMKVAIFDKHTVESIANVAISESEWNVIVSKLSVLNWFDINDQICEITREVKGL